MAEEQKWHEPGGHKQCIKNCGFIGNPTTLNLCPQCYKDYCMEEQQRKEAKLAMKQQSESFSSSSSSKPSSFSPESLGTNQKHAQLEAEAKALAIVSQPKRCPMCRKRVGLTGFKCRCGIMFCASHRYPEQHKCTFDYKAMGREAIAKANPVVQAQKLNKI